MNIYFILWVIIKYDCIYSVVQIISTLAGPLEVFSWLLYFFDIPHHWGLFRVFLFYCFALFFVCLFWELPYFLVLQDAPGSFHIFLALVLESDVPPRSAGFFYCRMVKHKTKQQDLKARCFTFYEALLVIYNHFFLKKKKEQLSWTFSRWHIYTW